MGVAGAVGHAPRKHDEHEQRDDADGRRVAEAEGDAVEGPGGQLAEHDAGKQQHEAEGAGGNGCRAPALGHVPHDDPEIHEEAAEAREGDGHARNGPGIAHEG